ncbi:family 16 glycoside hydrolase [Paenibacillus ferrarius]|uniref:family 16 glycoside hydrolase n=1 Tax=Paenibacillus ferrarius TaxID=1469647 RepID=UPI003D298351
MMISFRKWFTLLLAVALLLGALPAHHAEASSIAVVPIDWSSFTAGNPTDSNSLRVRSLLLNSNKYALTTWWTNKGFAAQSGAYLTFGGVDEPNIRPPASEALALAISLKTGAYDASATGVTQANALAIAKKLTASLAYQHKVTTASGWGNGWQTAFWAYLAGTAGFILWDDLSATDREYVRTMVEYEANRFNSYTVPYYRNKSGTIISAGDTKAEENAWNSSLLQLATAMMPDHPNWSLWMNKNIELMISAYSRPSDTTSTRVLHGKTVAQWLNGSNANEDGTVVNHNIIHPDYMTSITQLFNAPLLYTLAGKPTPEAFLFNADVVYDSLVDLNFASPPYGSPGGTIYVDGSSSIYYPQGNDWGTMRRMQFAFIDATAAAFGFDTLASQKGSYWEPYHAQMVLDMQNRAGHTDGHTYEATAEDTYAGREEWVAQFAGRDYLTKWMMGQNKYALTNQAYPVPSAPAPGDPFNYSFEDGTAGGWTPVNGTWNVVTDGASKVYKQTATSGESLSVVGDSSAWRNYSLEATVKLYDSIANNASGIVGRYADNDNYYLFRLTTTGKAQLYRKSAGSFTLLQETAMTVTTGTAYTLKLQMNGNSLAGYVNGSLMVSASDSTISAGRIGFRTYNQTASIDNVAVVLSLPYSDNFEDGDAYSWAPTTGTWSVVTDGNAVYKQTATGGEAVTITGNSAWSNYAVQANVKLYDALSFNASGVIARYQDADNYYLFRITTDDVVQLYRKSGGAFTLLQDAPLTVNTGTTYTLKLALSGSSITGYVGGVPLISVTDSTIASGKIGFRTYKQTASFDEVSVN